MVLNRKKLLLFFGLMGMIFCTLGLPFKKMNFFWDSYGIILHAVEAEKTGGLLKELFINDIRSEETTWADNENQHIFLASKASGFFSFVYRPLYYVYQYVQFKLFGYSPYAFFLVMIFLHACVTGLLFLLLAKFLPLCAATLLACFFAYNHAWWVLLRWIAVNFYFLEALFLMLFLWFLYKTLTTNQFWWSIPAALCLFHNLLLKEQSIALLPWVGMVFLAEQVLVRQGRITDWRWIQRCALFSMPSVIAVGSWVLLRWHVFHQLRAKAGALLATPVIQASGLWQHCEPFFRLAKDSRYWVVDLVGLNWFPPFHKSAKAFFLLLFVLFFIWLLRAIKPRGWFLFFAGSYWLFAWPTYTLRGYHPRYVYFATIFFVGLVALALKIFYETNWRHYRFAVAGLALITMLNAGFLVKRMYVSEQETDLVANSFTTLVAENPKIFERTMCFYGLPPELFDACVAQAMAWLAPGRQRRTIYYFKHEKTREECKIEEAFLATDPLFITWDAAKQKMIIV